MDIQSLIGYEINEAIRILNNNSSKKVIIKDNNSNLIDNNYSAVVRITEFEDSIEIITSKFKYLK